MFDNGRIGGEIMADSFIRTKQEETQFAQLLNALEDIAESGGGGGGGSSLKKIVDITNTVTQTNFVSTTQYTLCQNEIEIEKSGLKLFNFYTDKLIRTTNSYEGNCYVFVRVYIDGVEVPQAMLNITRWGTEGVSFNNTCFVNVESGTHILRIDLKCRPRDHKLDTGASIKLLMFEV